MKNIIISLLLVCLNTYLCGQERRFDRLDISKGLSHNLVFDIDIDKEGNIWAATADGTNKYNGYSFTVYKSDIERKNNINGSIGTSVKVDNNGDVWILTFEGGLNKYNTKRNTFIHYPDSILTRYTRQLFNDIHIVGDTSIWVNSENYIGVYNANSDNHYSFLNGKGVLGITGTDNDVYCFGLGGVKRMNYSNSEGIHFKTVFADTVYWMGAKEETFYIFNNDGLISLDKDFNCTDTIISLKTNSIPFIPANITDIILSDTEIWIGTLRGLYNLRNNILSKNLLPEQNISRLKYDNAGNLWIGTSIGGLLFYSRDKNQFKYYHIDNREQKDLPFLKVTSICKLKNGEIWYGLNSGGIRVLKNDRIKKAYRYYTDRNNQQVPFNAVRCIFEDSQHNIWVGTNNLCLYNNKLDRIEGVNHKYNLNDPGESFSIKEFEKGTVTLSAGKEIANLNLETEELNIFPGSRNGVYLWAGIKDIVKDKYKSYWIVQNTYGVIKASHDLSTYKRYITSNSDLPDNLINALQPQGDSLWIASNTGLHLMNIDKDSIIKSYSKEDGLSDNVVKSIHLNDKDEIWMSTGKGICKLDIRRGQITSFLDNDYYSNDAFYFHNDGEIFYGGYIGITSFLPENIKDLSYKPVPVIEKFLLFNREINPGDTVKGKVVWEIDNQKESIISLNYKQNSISFTFNSFPFDIPKTHLYRYRLSENQSVWNYADKGTRNVTFNELRPGEYNFQLEVSSDGKVWSNPTQITILIKPPFWSTYWFRTLLLLFILLAIVAYFRIRTATIKRNNIILQKKVNKQTKQLVLQNKRIKRIADKLHKADQAKLRFFTDVSHEFRTPITLILGHLDSITKGVNSKSSRIIYNNAQRLLNLVNDLIDVRKLDQGHSKLNISLFDIVEFTRNIAESFKVIAEQKKISISFISEHKQHEIWLDKNKMEQIIFNLISNAIKYIPENKDIVVRIEKLQNEIEIIVEDNGHGIPPDQIKKIFNRFYQLENTSIGHGIGLSLVKGLVDLQKGTINVRSEKDKGTAFILKFRLGKKHFNKSDFGEVTSESSLQVIPQEISYRNMKFSAGQKILIVEDNTDLQNYLSDLLQKYFNIEVASNGADALEKLKDFLPDLIISDIMMPIMDGLKLCEELKSNIAYSGIPFILLTAKTNPESQIDAFNHGAEDYIEKPFNPNILLARINALLLKTKAFKTELQASNKKETIRPDSFSKSDYELWVRINKIIEDNYSDVDFGKDNIVEMLNISPSTLQRKFKKLTGQSVPTYLRKYRLKKAFDMIYDDDMDMIQLSLNSGFKSISQFRINFKEEFGKTPAEFRKMK